MVDLLDDFAAIRGDSEVLLPAIHKVRVVGDESEAGFPVLVQLTEVLTVPTGSREFHIGEIRQVGDGQPPTVLGLPEGNHDETHGFPEGHILRETSEYLKGLEGLRQGYSGFRVGVCGRHDGIRSVENTMWTL